MSAVDKILDRLGETNFALDGARKVAVSVKKFREQLLGIASHSGTRNGRAHEFVLRVVALSSSRRQDRSTARSEVHKEAAGLARAVESFLEAFPDQRTWWERIEPSDLCEYLDAEVWPLKPLAELQSFRDKVLSQRQDWCAAALLVVNGAVDGKSLDRLLVSAKEWVSYIVPIVNVLSGGQPMHREALKMESPKAAPAIVSDEGRRLFGSTIMFQGQELVLTKQLARMLELALRPDGSTFDSVRKGLGLEEENDSGIRARVSKLNKRLRRETRRLSFSIYVSTKDKRLVARTIPKPAAEKLPA